jgi:hypothetical protein
MSTLVRTVVWLILFIGVGLVVSAFEPFQMESAHDADMENEQADDYLYGFLLNRLPVFRLNPSMEPEQFYLDAWIAEQNKPAVLLFINHLWPDGFAQIRPLGRLSQNCIRDDVVFAAVYLHRKPIPYLNYVNQTLPADHYQFSADIHSFQTVYMDYSQPLTLFTNAEGDIIMDKHRYLSYQNLYELYRHFHRKIQELEGESP